jgi:hypothetical protein
VLKLILNITKCFNALDDAAKHLRSRFNDPELFQQFEMYKMQILDLKSMLLLFVRCEMAARLYSAIRELIKVDFASS